MIGLLAITPQPNDGIVVITGMSLVFLILVVLALIIMAQGKIFDYITAKKEKAHSAKASESAARAQAVSTAASSEPKAPAVEAGIPQEVVAAIAAALACISGGKYQLRAVRKARRDGWSQSSLLDETQPF